MDPAYPIQSQGGLASTRLNSSRAMGLCSCTGLLSQDWIAKARLHFASRRGVDECNRQGGAAERVQFIKSAQVLFRWCVLAVGFHGSTVKPPRLFPLPPGLVNDPQKIQNACITKSVFR